MVEQRVGVVNLLEHVSGVARQAFALVPVIFPPIIRLLTTKEERFIPVKQAKPGATVLLQTCFSTFQLGPRGPEQAVGPDGHFTLQALLYPLIEKSNGRIVTVGSMGYNMGIKTIKFDDMNWDQDYTPNDAYSQSKLAQIMSIYELQDRLAKAGKTGVKAYACHPGSSRTSLIKTSGSLMMRIIFGLMKLSPLTQSAEKGAYPELMCATEEDLDQKGFYGPTGRSNWTGPVGAHKLEPHAKDKAVAKRLWDLSEKETGLKWNF